MNKILERYLDRVFVYANKPEAEAKTIRQELRDHLLQKMDDLVAGGLPREEALLEALRLHGSPKVIGYALRGPFPWVDIRSFGTARGVVAIGPKAVGIFAFGGIATGVFACGGFSLGLFSFGGFALGLLFCWGGVGIGVLAYAGMALGLVAAGAMAVGAVAEGEVAIGAWVPEHFRGATSISHYTAGNAPGFLKGLAALLRVPMFIDRYIIFFLPSYCVAVAIFFYVQYREGKRTRRQEDWLLDG